MCAYGMLSQRDSTIKRAWSPNATNMHLISYMRSLSMWCKTTFEKYDLEAVWKELIDELARR